MKIITQESFNNNIEYSIRKDLLIPCFVYKIPIITSRDKSLNFIEETIIKLIEIDDSLKQDVIRLSKMLGFYSEKSSEDKTKIITLILNKIKDLRIDKRDDEENTEVTIYQFYQEAYSSELLPIVTKEINDFSFIEKDQHNDENTRIISFKKDIQSKKQIKAILVNGFNKENRYKPAKSDIIKIIFTHNKNNYQGTHTIDYNDFNIEIYESELVYLHVKLFIPKKDIQSFVITNGFTNDFSTVLRKTFEDKHQNILKIFRQDIKSDNEDYTRGDINVPFEKTINRFNELKKLIENIEYNTTQIQQEETTKEDIKKSKDYLIQSMYDLLEKSFSIFSKDFSVDKSLQNKKLLNSLAKEFGFTLPTKKHLSIFNVDSRDNLQKHLSKSLIYKKDELYELASLFPNMFSQFNNLLKLRNGVKHSDKEKTLEKVEIKRLIVYRDTIYKVISVILKIKQKEVTQEEIENDNSYIQNAYIDLEEELNMDIMNKLAQEIKDNLTSINFYLHSAEFNVNKFNVVKEVINSLYSSFEFIIKENIDILLSIDNNIVSKDKILEKIRKNIEVGESLYRVSPKMIELAFQRKGASLGAYMLVFLYHEKDIAVEDVRLIEKIISLRGHGSPNIEDVEKVSKETLLDMKEKSFKLIEKLYGER